MSKLAILYGDLFDASQRNELEARSGLQLHVEFRDDCDLPTQSADTSAVVVDLDDPRYTSPEFLLSLSQSVGTAAVTGASRDPALDVQSFWPLGVSRVLSPEQCLAHLHKFLGSLENVVSNEPVETSPVLGGLVGSSNWMHEISRTLKVLSEVDFPMALILGETGTGKSMVARILHNSGLRRTHHLVEVNCSTIPDLLFESEFFGHRKGAFTDARDNKEGLFEHAHDGTLFLDEIGNLSLSAQAKLLKVLEDRKVRRIGETEERNINVRVLAATNRNLVDCVAAGTFREDLYYRLNLLTIKVPPLRERLEDIPELARHYVQQYSSHYGRSGTTLSDSALDKLSSHDWPGNVRELCNVLERAVLMNTTGTIHADKILVGITKNRRRDDVKHRLSVELPATGKELREIEREVVLKVLDLFEGNRSRAATYLGISRPRLRRILEDPSLDKG